MPVFPVGFGEPGAGDISFFSAPPCSLLSLLSVGSDGVSLSLLKMYPVTAVCVSFWRFYRV